MDVIIADELNLPSVRLEALAVVREAALRSGDLSDSDGWRKEGRDWRGQWLERVMAAEGETGSRRAHSAHNSCT